MVLSHDKNKNTEAQRTQRIILPPLCDLCASAFQSSRSAALVSRRLELLGALACPDCNRYKGPNLTTLDSQTREFVRLFHPRQDNWDDHLAYDGILILGRTTIGKATVSLLCE